MMAVLGFGPPAAAHAADFDVIEDPAFAACINEKLARPAPHDQPITESDAARITSALSCTYKGITNVEGAQHLTGLPSLNLGWNSITDASVLGQLTNLNSLHLTYNHPLESIDFVSTLAGLQSFSINSSPNIGDSISALGSLPTLRDLTLNNIGLGDLSPLATIGSLEELAVSNNVISDVTPLANLSKLSKLRLQSNEVSDFSALQGLELTTFNAGRQWVTGGTLYVPSGATSYTVRTPSTEILGRAGTPASIIVPDEYSDHYTLSEGSMTFTVEPGAENLRAAFEQLTPPESFDGHVTHPVVWSEFTSAAPTATRVGESFFHAFVVTEGFPTEAMSIAAGDVPGLTLSEDGILSGVPAAAGSYPIAISATDASGNAITTEYLVEVAAALAPPLITTTELAAAKVGSAYDDAVAATGLQPVTFAVTAGTLPTGMQLGADGTVSGTPAEAGEFTVTITATNPDGADNRDFTLVVAAAVPPVVDPPAADSAGAGTAGTDTAGAGSPAPDTALARSGAEVIPLLSVAWGFVLLGAALFAARSVRIRRGTTL